MNMEDFVELVFIDTGSAQWTVRDAAVMRGRYIVLPLGSPRAQMRIFARPDGQLRAYEFPAGEQRGTRASHLQRQLDRSRELPREFFDPALVLIVQATAGAKSRERLKASISGRP